MAKKKKKGNMGAISAIIGAAGAAKDAAAVTSKKTSKKAKQAAQKRLKSYSSGNQSVYVPKQARTVKPQASRQNTEKVKQIQQKTQKPKTQVTKPTVSAYEKYQKARKQQEQLRKTAAAKSSIKAPLSNEAQKKAQQAAAKKQDTRVKQELDKKLTQVGAKGLAAQQQQVKESRKQIHKESEQAKKEKKAAAPKQMTTDEALRMQWAASNPTYRAKKGGDKVITKDLQKKIQHNIQADYDRGSVGTGFMSGSMPVADLKQSVEKKYGVKLDDSKAKESLSWKIGEAAGYLAKSATFGGAGEAQIAKALTKVVAKKTGKKVTSKGVKFGINRASEAIASTPINAEDAAKNSKNAKEFGQNLAVNAALDAGLGSAVDGVKLAGRAAKTAKAKTLHSAIQKTAKGQTLTADEAKALERVTKRVEKKQQKGSALNTEERLVNKVSAKGQAVQETPTRATQTTKGTAMPKTTAQSAKPAVRQETVTQGAKAAVKPEKKLAQAKTETVKIAQTKEESVRQLQALATAKDLSDSSGRDMHHVQKVLRKDADSTFETEAQKLADYVYNYKGKGSTFHQVPVRDKYIPGTDEQVWRGQRVSNNDLIYQEVLKAYGKKPSKAQAREFAEDKILEDIEQYQKTGETYYIEPEAVKAILLADDLDNGMALYRDGALKGIKARSYEAELTYQGKNPNAQKGTAKRLNAESREVLQGRKADREFSQQVDKVLTGELQPGEELTIGKTPQKLQEHGASDIDMTMKQSTIKKTAYPAGYMDALKGVETRNSQGHNLGIGTVKNIRKDLENPVAILKSDTQKDSFVVFINKVDRDNNPIMVAVHLDKNGALGVGNEVASEYGKGNYSKFIAAQREKGNVLYENEKIGLDELPGNGLQLPELGDTSDPINTLYQNEGKVNGEISDEALFRHAKKMRDSGFSDTDIADQFRKMGVDSKRAENLAGRKTVAGPADGKPRSTKAEEVKSHNPKELYKSATKGITDEEVSQHYAKLSAQIMEDVKGNPNVFETLEVGEKQGIFGKVKGISQEDALRKAEGEEFDDCFRKFMETEGVSGDAHLFEARGKVLYDKLVEKINAETAAGGMRDETVKQYMSLFEKATEFASASGRALNAVKMILRATPQGRLRMVDKEVKRLNTRFADRLKGESIELSEDQMARIIRAETDEEVEAVMEAINVEIWDKIPATMFEKINEIRHCSMLFNAKTHLRNLAGNEAFRQARNVSNCIEIGLNKLFKSKIESRGGNVDMVHVPRKELRENSEYLDGVFDQVYQESGSVSRYIESYRPDGSQAIKSSILNKPIQANYKLLEREDMLVFKPEFKKNYARWCKSHGIDMSNLQGMTKKQQAAAGEYAMRQAELATFRDASALSNFITGKKTILAGKKGNTALGTAAYRAGNALLESQLPFVKTPINVFRRSVDYSPLGLVRGTAELIGAKDVEVLKQGIHHLATGLTGTGVCALGAYLYSKDFITLKAGGVSGDEYYDRDMGYQDYSIVFHVGGKAYSATIDWASPMNVSLFMGAQVMEDLSDRDNLTLTGVLKGLESISGPMLDMSFLSTAKDTIDMFQEQAFRHSEEEGTDYSGAIIQSLFGSLPQGYLSSFVPQLVTQGAQAFDGKQRDTRSTIEDPLAKSWESWSRKMVNRIPGLRNYLLNPKLDRFGNDKETGNNVVLRILNAYVNPSNTKEIHLTKLDRDIIEIYNHMPTDTSDEKKAKKYFFYNFTGNPSYDLGDGRRMTYDEAYQYGKSKRKRQTTLIEDMTKAKSYQDMTWNMRSEEVSDAHWISQTVADRDTYGYSFAAKRIAQTEWEAQNLKAYKGLGGSDKDYVNYYIQSRTFYSRAHNNDRYDYYTKALAVVKYGDSKLMKVLDIHTDKIANAKEYLKKGGSTKEYSDAMCQVMSGIDKAQVSSSIKNMAISAADFDINKRTRKAMGLTKDKSNMGIGLKKYGYTYESLDKMRMDCKYEYDKDKSGTLSKSEMVEYINSLGLKHDAEKACLFEYLYGYSGANPWTIPNYLDMDDEESSSKGGSGGYRRYGRRYRRYGRRGSSRGRSGSGSSGSTSSVSEETALEKYTRALKAQPKRETVSVGKVATAKRSYSSGSSQVAKKASYTKKSSSKLDISVYQSDAFRRAVVKLLAKQRKGS